MYINALDIETFTENGKTHIYCICFSYNKEVYSFYGLEAINDFFLFIEKNKIYATFYVHNLSFDGGMLLNSLKNKEYRLNGFFFKGSIYNLTIEGENFKLYLKCSYRLYPSSLKEIGKLLGIKKIDNFPHAWVKSERLFYRGEHPYNQDRDALNSSNNEKVWDLKKETIKYCVNDVIIVCKLVTKIYNEFRKIESILNARQDCEKQTTAANLIASSLSISSLALNVYKIFFNKGRLSFENSLENDAFIRLSYYGGRCEVFGNSEDNEKIHHFDFTGMYSQIMEESFPFGKTKKKTSDLVNLNSFKKLTEPGFYSVKVKSKSMEIPVLPRRDFIDSKLTFPNGEWSGVYWWEELNFFLEEGGTILKIYEYWTFEKNEKIFIDFVCFFKSLRKGDDFNNKFWKLFVNSLSGRLGIKPDFTTTKLMSKEEYYEKRSNLNIIKEIFSGSAALITYERENKRENGTVITIPQTTEANVFIAAAITAKARIKLCKSILETIRSGGRVLYCDTDSIFAVFKEERYNERLGNILWDKKEIDEAIFAIPKGYAIKKYNGESTVKLKGYRRDSINYEEFKKIWEHGNKVTVKETQLSKKDFEWNFEEIEKVIYINNYTKRKFNEKKTLTTPITVHF